MAPLKPGDEALDELGERAGPLVDGPVLLVVREVIEGRDPLANRPVEELETRGNEPLDATAVQPGEARQLVVFSQIELREDEREDLGVLGANPVVRRWRQTELRAEPPSELGRALESASQLLVRLREADGLGHEESHRERQLARLDAARHVLKRDPGLLEREHEPDDVYAGGAELPVLVRLEQAELHEPAHVLERTRDELGQLLRGDRGHARAGPAGRTRARAGARSRRRSAR